jgi:DNA-binding transcriptional LysR family regulator
MELRHLRYFVAVAKHRSFVKAAESLHISQPPLSRQIHELEREIGTVLFERRGNKTIPTRAGEYFHIEAARLLEGIAGACRTARIIGDARLGDLKIGCVSFLLETRILPFLGEFRRLHPETKLHLMCMSTEEQQGALLSGTIDIGFVGSWIEDAGLFYESLISENLSLIFPPGSCAGTDAPECFGLLQGLPLIAVSSSLAPGLRNRLDEVYGEYGFQPAVGLECNDASVIINLVTAGLGWSIVPDFDVGKAKDAGVGILGLPQKITFGICRRRAPLSESGEAFCVLARSHFAAEVGNTDASVALSYPQGMGDNKKSIGPALGTDPTL